MGADEAGEEHDLGDHEQPHGQLGRGHQSAALEEFLIKMNAGRHKDYPSIKQNDRTATKSIRRANMPATAARFAGPSSPNDRGQISASAPGTAIPKPRHRPRTTSRPRSAKAAG